MAINVKDKLITLESFGVAYSAEQDAREEADQALSTRIDNIVAPEGDPSLSEVADARTSGSTTYNTLKARLDADKAAIGTEISQLSADISESFETEKQDIVTPTTIVKSNENIGYINIGGFKDASATSYFFSEYIPVKKNDLVTAMKVNGESTPIRYITAYDADKTADSTKGWNNPSFSTLDAYVVPEGIAFIRATLYSSQGTTQVLNVTTIDGKTTYYAKTVLTGKKWVACGDSFTEGDFTGATVDNWHITSGKYKGQKRVYPYIIGNRNNMNIVNEAISGTTMAHIDGRTTAFSDTRYQNIPADADYITLKFGINDDSSHQNVPIGTITDGTTDDPSDPGNTTFYGAYNIVMKHLILHHLNAKIGIIVTNGSKLDIVNATIAIAEKWGVPYLNEATGEQCSYVFRSNRTDIPSEIRNAKNENWYVKNPDNPHPNAEAHEFESTVVEAWLRSL